MEKISLDILPKVLDKKYWEDRRNVFHYTGHDHFMSPYECDDNCGTCGGARCDRCRKVYDGFDFVYSSYQIYELTKEFGVTEEEAYDLYEYGKTDKYLLHIPTEYDLKTRYPEFYQELYK